MAGTMYLHVTEAVEAVPRNSWTARWPRWKGYSDAGIAAAPRFLTDVCEALERSSRRG
jgi:hypothetical protein